MIAGVFALLLANAGALATALRWRKRLPRGGPAHDLTLLVFLRLLVMSAWVLLLGCAGLLRPWALGALGGLALAGAVWRGGWPSLGTLRPLRPLPWPWALLVALLGLRLLAQTWWFAPYVGDTLSYHLPKVAAWVQAGALTTSVGPNPLSWFPAGFELIETWWTVFLHHDVLIEVAGIEFLLLGAAAVAALAESLGLPPGVAARAGVLYALIPAAQHQATSCLNDLPAAAVLLTAFALAAADAPWPLWTAAIGLGLGIKPTVAYALPGLVLLVWLRGRRPAPSRWAYGPLAAAAFVGLFWYARNLWLFGNPIHPMGTEGVAGSEGHVMQQFGPRLSSLLRNLAILSNRLADPGATGPLLEGQAGWGVVALSLGLPGLLVGLHGLPALRRPAAAFAVSLLSVLALVVPDPWNLRFVLFFPALLAIGAALLVARLPALRWLLGAGILLQVLDTTVPAQFAVDGVRDLAAQPWSKRRTLALPHDPWSSDVVAVGPGANRTYLLYRPDYSRTVVFVTAEDAVSLVTQMKACGARILHASARPPGVEEALRRGLLRREPGNFFALP